MKDLTIMVSDKHIEAVVNSLLARPKAIGIKEISWETTVDTNCALGCANNGIYNPQKERVRLDLCSTLSFLSRPS